MNGEKLKAVVTGARTVDVQALADVSDGPQEATIGILMPNTIINLMKAPDANLKIKASSKRAAPNAIIKPNFKFQDMGIGGLDSEFGAIFRRAFASRIFPPGMVEKLGIQHVKGILCIIDNQSEINQLIYVSTFRFALVWSPGNG